MLAALCPISTNRYPLSPNDAKAMPRHGYHERPQVPACVRERDRGARSPDGAWGARTPREG